MINGDANGPGKAGVNPSNPQFLDREASAFAGLTTVPESGLVDDGSEGLEGSREESLRFLLSLLKASEFSGRLGEVGLDEALPVLAKVRTLQGIVVDRHFIALLITFMV